MIRLHRAVRTAGPSITVVLPELIEKKQAFKWRSNKTFRDYQFKYTSQSLQFHFKKYYLKLYPTNRPEDISSYFFQDLRQNFVKKLYRGAGNIAESFLNRNKNFCSKYKNAQAFEMTSYVKQFFNFIRSFTIYSHEVNYQNAQNLILYFVLHQRQSNTN